MTDPRGEYSSPHPPKVSSRTRELLAVVLVLVLFALAYVLIHAWLVQVPDRPDPRPLHVLSLSR